MNRNKNFKAKNSIAFLKTIIFKIHEKHLFKIHDQAFN